MWKDRRNKGVSEEKNVFCFEEVVGERKIEVDLNGGEMWWNGGVVVVGVMKERIGGKIGGVIGDYGNELLVEDW